MSERHINYKFKSQNKFETIKIYSESIFLTDLKLKIIEHANLGMGTENELFIYDAQSGHEYTNPKQSFSNNTSIIIERRNITPQQNIIVQGNNNCQVCQNSLLFMTQCCYQQTCKICYDRKIEINPSKCPLCQKQKTLPIQIKSNKQQLVNPENQKKTQFDQMLDEARYFIIKSKNIENINLARAQGIWATTVANQVKINDAYMKTKNVLLLFSVNNSQKFQGFARMESSLDRSVSGVPWVDKETIRLGHPFKIKWHRFSEVLFSKIKNHVNTLNDNEPIVKSRDTQEIPIEIGKYICQLFDVNDLPLPANAMTQFPVDPYSNPFDSNPHQRLPFQQGENPGISGAGLDLFKPTLQQQVEYGSKDDYDVVHFFDKNDVQQILEDQKLIEPQTNKSFSLGMGLANPINNYDNLQKFIDPQISWDKINKNINRKRDKSRKRKRSKSRSRSNQKSKKRKH